MRNADCGMARHPTGCPAGHSAFRIPHSTLHVPHSAFRIPHSAFPRLPMSDELDRLFACLVEALARETRISVPFVASEVYERLVPYRSNRSRLKVATHQDYEMAVLRLLAGERGYVRLEPEEVREGMKREVTSVNPDPTYFRNFPDARVMVNRRGEGEYPLGGLLSPPP